MIGPIAQGSLDPGSLLAILLGGGVITAAVQAYLAKANRTKIGGNAAESISAAADRVVKAYQEDNSRLRSELSSAHKRVDSLEVELNQCERELERLRDRLEAVERGQQQ